MRIEEARRTILDAFLAGASTHGWSERCLRVAAAAVDNDLARVAFPHGIADVTRTFLTGTDACTAAALAGCDLEAMRVRERITAAVRLRLEQHSDHQLALRALTATLATPRFAGLGARALWDTVDTLWYAVGERAIDFSYYSRRALLAAVYATTLLYWLDDTSANRSMTWRFLDDRIEDVMGIHRLRGRIESILSWQPFADQQRRSVSSNV